MSAALASDSLGRLGSIARGVSGRARMWTDGAEDIVVGLVNNMPVPEWLNTELQFRAVLSAASAAVGVRVQLRMFALHGKPSTTSQRQNVGNCENIAALWDSKIDGVIVTGTEPKTPALTAEPYWPTFVKLINWASEHTYSTIWSCLAAHAAVFHLDTIERKALPRKLSGMFDCLGASPNLFGALQGANWSAPHSRQNGLAEAALRHRGYEILSHSPEAGPDIFVKHMDSLFVFLQGHLEYDANALFREYRRDVARYLRSGSEIYPELPLHYLDTNAAGQLLSFRQRAIAERSVDLLPHFPLIERGSIAGRWHEPAVALYSAWIEHILAARIRKRLTVEPSEGSGPQPDAAVPNTSLLESSPFFPSLPERRRWQDDLTERLSKADRRVKAGGPNRGTDIREFRKGLVQFDFAAPVAMDKLLSWTISAMEGGNVQVTHPRYLGLFNPTPTLQAQCGDRIAAAFNPQLASASTSPAAVAIEKHTVQAVARRAGMDCSASGHFTTGGSEANATALLCALTRACPGFALDGARAFGGPPTFYVSQDSHLAWIKIAHMAGIGRHAARLVATDGYGRMDLVNLIETIQQDRVNGCVPVMIGATAGTTSAGMIDPLRGCADISLAAGMWFHVDAAWGGALIASDNLRPQLVGLEQSDSFTLDAHKWLSTTMGCGMFITKHAELLTDVFKVTTGFMPANVDGDDDLYATSIQWSRRFRGLGLFLSLAATGWDGYARHVEQAISHAALLNDILSQRGWRILNNSCMAVLCIQSPLGGPDAATIVARILRSGSAWLSKAQFESQDVVRICITNGETTREDIVAVADALQRALAGDEPEEFRRIH